ncbi:O-linked N-acetylglucosamine transferase, SPINDLY family protein [Chlorogloeopsis sp. ULAP01]|uniref:O-linked N-acetylglucosamine transferase, SPINDLY family protein n=1 Tax=Chlorogloeopsis sp. ULAP01 TaxID=3056483 RepID=UPI0025AA656F|nr:O-linked N-acetylglucosamine transferase, SPINDLY family protein [Chlorogloeopsis sp. ULAP01]MDM9379954.1 O-linked N-acetylglucosamine transferase, SPINDLY family protein [Chlorogloeopsis sp. ULAP01]
MNVEISVNKFTNWQQQAHQHLIEGHYEQAAYLYEQGIASEPDVISHYWYLGLMLLLQGKEIEAQMTWMMPLSEDEPEKVNDWIEELIQVLQTEAERQEALEYYKVAWAIRQHMREINPDNLDNLLHIIQLSPKLDIYQDEELPLFEAAQILETSKHIKCDANLLLQILQLVLEIYPLQTSAFEFIVACIENTNNPAIITKIICDQSVIFINSLSSEKAVALCKKLLALAQTDISFLVNFANLYQNSGRNLESLEFTQRILSNSPSLVDEVAANYLTLRGLMRAGGQWQKADSAYQKYENLLGKLIESDSYVPEEHLVNLISTVAFSPYLQDEPARNHLFRNQVSKFCQERIQKQLGLFQPKKISNPIVKFVRPLKIGYISTCLRRHSVGWLSRWIFKYHDREKFQIYAYSLEGSNDNLQEFISQQISEFYDLSQTQEIIEIAELIHKNEIDVLIDLDSVTSKKVCGVMALKPAPVQVTWLGSDASGLTTIDYFIADPYVLPDSAQKYYTSTIWRLPNTYIAVDGFEVGIPTLRREQLNIPNDAVIYLSSQTPYKRHPNTVRSQIRILKEVPESYLLIKGQNEQDSMKKFFEQIAEEEGVSCSRLRFLPLVDLESVHRANLGIADVVLDTYPYNGATTTLETLWMCIPLVSRVGEQFAARNSYTMMMNAGITEGIAWTDEEYIEWGVRLGKDAGLRQQISWRLRQSRQTAPLWNAKQFTREMEKAYEQMWQRYKK